MYTFDNEAYFNRYILINKAIASHSPSYVNVYEFVLKYDLPIKTLQTKWRIIIQIS